MDYLEAYARHFGLAPQFGAEVSRVARGPGVGGASLPMVTEAAAVVVCMGYNRVPVRPTWPGQEGFAGEVLHSGDYRDGAPFRGTRVLVVGAGNSGAEIALDLWESGASGTVGKVGAVEVEPSA